MSILDDAIREHLELKRAHGADAAELKKLEDEAFGPPARPDEQDPFAEAPTEFLAAPEGGAEGEGNSGGRRVEIADLQEAPEPPKEQEPAEVPEAEQQAEAPEADASPEAEAPEEPEVPAEEEHPAMEHETVPEPEPGHSTEERHAIAEQPTELFDVEGEIETGPDATSPSDEELLDAGLSEPRLAPVDPLAEVDIREAESDATEGVEDEDDDLEDEDDDFWSEQRLSDELDQALEAPATEEHPVPAADDDEELDDDEPDDDDEHETGAAPQHEDVLEDTPDFLEDAPEDDDLWFEQRPPKDFDFDD
jgi:hypothetical protein